jgi:hypothetical protein
VADTPRGRPLRIPSAFDETRAYLNGVEHARGVYRRLYASELGFAK